MSGACTTQSGPPRRRAELHWTPGAAEHWAAVYAELAQRPRLGMAGAIAARAEAQIARLALVYALLDMADAVGVEHLDAALALWDYAERSAVYLFGASTGNRDADLVLRLLRTEGTLDRLTIRAETGLRRGSELDEIERVLVDAGLAELVELPRPDGTKGRGRRALRLRDLSVLSGLSVTDTAHVESTETVHDIPALSALSTESAHEDSVVRGPSALSALRTVRSADPPAGPDRYRAEIGTEAAWGRVAPKGRLT